MKLNDQQEKIEKYLLNQLSPLEEMEFRGALINDPALRREVHLTRLAMRALHQQPAPAASNASIVRTAILATVSLLLIGLVVWSQYGTPSSSTPTPDSADTIRTTTPQDAHIELTPQVSTEEPQAAQPRPISPSPIAAARPAQDEILASYLQPSQWRTSKEVTSLNTPYSNYTVYKRNETGDINFYWNGIITGTPKPKTTIEILLFPDDDQYLQEERPLWSAIQTVSTNDSVRIHKWLNLAPGKYYLMVKDSNGKDQHAEIINTNVFWVN